MTYSDDFLGALGAWQRGWKERAERRLQITERLLAALSATGPLPEAAYQVHEKCYRKRFLAPDNPESPGGDLYGLVMLGRLEEGVASWTTDVRFAQEFKGPVRDATISAVFGHTPIADEVILNIRELWELPCFRQAVQDFSKRGGENADAILNFKSRQSEVILKAPLLREDVEGFCAISSPFDVLCEVAGCEDEEAEDRLWKSVVENNMLPGGARWLQKEAAQRVLNETYVKFDARVREVKNRSNS